MLDLSAWPKGMRVIVRKERPHPGAQLRFTDIDGHRFTCFATSTKGGSSLTWNCATAAGPGARTVAGSCPKVPLWAFACFPVISGTYSRDKPVTGRR